MGIDAVNGEMRRKTWPSLAVLDPSVSPFRGEESGITAAGIGPTVR